MTEKIRIVLSTDLHGMRWNATLLASVVRRASIPVEVRVYTRGFCPESFEIDNLKVDFVEAGGRVTGSYPGHVSNAVFDRLRIIKDEDEWDRVLVLDHDMIALCDLAPYFEENFEGNLLMARVFGPGNTLGLQMDQRKGLPSGWCHAKDYPYFFMGPMMNLRAMREAGTWDLLQRAHREIGQDEQISLTAATGGKVKAVGKKWNLVPQWDHLDKISSGLPLGRSECDGIFWNNRCPEGIIHWSEFHKPWQHQSRVWRADLWHSERVTWEHLRRGLWEKPVALEFDPVVNSDISLLCRGWKVFVKGHRVEPLVEESFPDAFFLVENDQVNPNAQLIRFGPSTDLQEALNGFDEVPDQVICRGPRNEKDFDFLRGLGYRSEFRMDRLRWPDGGPHPEVVGYQRVSCSRALGFQEDCYLSRQETDCSVSEEQAEILSCRSIDPVTRQFLTEGLSNFSQPNRILELGDGRYLRSLTGIYPEAELYCLTSEAAWIDHLSEKYGDRAFFAPLEETLSWFDLSQIELPEVDFLIVNGPNCPGKPDCRSAATSILHRMAKGGTILLAETNKNEIRNQLTAWTDSGCRVLCEGFGYLLLGWAGEGGIMRKELVQKASLDWSLVIEKSYLISHPDRKAMIESQKRDWMQRVGLSFEVVTSLRPDLSLLRWEQVKDFQGDGSIEKLRTCYLEIELAWKQGLIEALLRFTRSGKEVAIISGDLFKWNERAREVVAKALQGLAGHEWDVVVLHSQSYLKFQAINEHVVRLSRTGPVTSALWTRSAAVQFLECLQDSAGEASKVFDRLIPDLSVYGVAPMAGTYVTRRMDE